jgi:hypothetical protein
VARTGGLLGVGYWGGLVGLEEPKKPKRSTAKDSDALGRLSYTNTQLAGRQKKTRKKVRGHESGVEDETFLDWG